MSFTEKMPLDDLGVAVESARQAPAFLAELESLLAEAQRQVDALSPTCGACGHCCDFARADHRLYVTAGELALVMQTPGGQGVPPLHCAFQVEGACIARAYRPLGCRMFFCDETTALAREAIYESHHRAIAALHLRYTIPYRYVELTAALTRLAG